MIVSKCAFIWLLGYISIIYPIQALPLQTIPTDAEQKLQMFGNSRLRSDQNVPLKLPLPREELKGEANEALIANSTQQYNRVVTRGFVPFLPNSTEEKLYENYKGRKEKSQRKINGSVNKKNVTTSARTTVSTFLNMFATNNRFRFGPRFEEIPKVTGRGPPPIIAPEDEEGGGEEGEEGGGEEGSEAGGEGSSEAGGEGGGGGTEGEITIAIPKFHRNEQGKWVYNKWQATYGKLWQDTQFTKGYYSLPRIEVDSNPVINYYPPDEVNSVCMDASTIYNVPAVKSWLSFSFQSMQKFPKKTIWNELRQEIYTAGNSEECHENMKYAKGLEYMECALKRNQRLEYLIPKYPLHQIVSKDRTQMPFPPTESS